MTHAMLRILPFWGGLFISLVLSMPAIGQVASSKGDVLTEKSARMPSNRVRFERLRNYVDERTKEFGRIDPERRKELQALAKEISDMKAAGKPVKLLFVCTANSRRSQMAEVWAATAAAHYDIPNIEVYSGGTGASGFNKRISKTLTGAGFEVLTRPGQNSQVLVRYSDRELPVTCYSKAHNDDSLPKDNFIAVMVCSDADAACPVMPGASKRICIPYEDPRLSDHSEVEREAYSESNALIAREMLYVMALVR